MRPAASCDDRSQPNPFDWEPRIAPACHGEEIAGCRIEMWPTENQQNRTADEGLNRVVRLVVLPDRRRRQERNNSW
jgi:hypothetical protein